MFNNSKKILKRIHSFSINRHFSFLYIYLRNFNRPFSKCFFLIPFIIRIKRIKFKAEISLFFLSSSSWMIKINSLSLRINLIQLLNQIAFRQNFRCFWNLVISFFLLKFCVIVHLYFKTILRCSQSLQRIIKFLVRIHRIFSHTTHIFPYSESLTSDSKKFQLRIGYFSRTKVVFLITFFDHKIRVFFQFLHFANHIERYCVLFCEIMKSKKKIVSICDRVFKVFCKLNIPFIVFFGNLRKKFIFLIISYSAQMSDMCVIEFQEKIREKIIIGNQVIKFIEW